MTGQSLLDRMEMVNQELQLQSGEADVTRGLTALNVAQDYFETLAAARKGISSAPTTVTTAASTETTAYPTGWLRIDRIFLLNATTNRPQLELANLKRVGGHASRNFWPLNIVASTTSGAPRAYWTDHNSIYWDPLPSGVNTLRIHGFGRATDITASGTFLYDDAVSFPLASFAARLMKIGVDDNANDLAGLAQETFTAVLNMLEMHNRDGAAQLEYTEVHSE